jgi:hypothetical protein
MAGRYSFTFARAFEGDYWPLGGVPTNYVIDRAGRLRYAKANAFDLNDLNTIVLPMLKE